MTLEKRIKEAAKIIRGSKHLVVFTGAGISTESGLPDYRGPDGVWTRRDKGLPPPKMSKRWCDVDPNEGHIVIKELQDLGLMKFLISQNVDNLHLKSGIKKDLIGEFHGNTTLMHCVECDKEFNKDEIWDERKWGKGYRTSKVVKGQPVCDECGGRLQSNVVNFGDPIPEHVLKKSYLHSGQADVFLVVGSSLTVTPAADMPLISVQNGGKLIIINKQETPFDPFCTVRFFEGAGEVLIGILKEIKKSMK